MQPYHHKVQYYETDRMGITHHSNYIRWMEEARVDFLAKIGWSYARMEQMGILSPVTAVDCRYKTSTTFDDEVEILIWVEELKNVKLLIGYRMTRVSDGAEVCTGHSEHCFLTQSGQVIRLRRDYPALYETLSSLAEQGSPVV